MMFKRRLEAGRAVHVHVFIHCSGLASRYNRRSRIREWGCIDEPSFTQLVSQRMSMVGIARRSQEGEGMTVGRKGRVWAGHYCRPLYWGDGTSDGRLHAYATPPPCAPSIIGSSRFQPPPPFHLFEFRRLSYLSEYSCMHSPCKRAHPARIDGVSVDANEPSFQI